MVVSKPDLNPQFIQQSLNHLLSESQLQQFLSQLQVIDPNPGELFRRFDQTEGGIYLILTGKVRLIDREDNLIASVTQGWLGQIGLFTDPGWQPYSLRASLGLKLAYLDAKSARFWFETHPQLQEYIYRQGEKLDLLMLCQQVSGLNSVEELLPILPLLTTEQFEPGILPDQLTENRQLWILRQGEMVHGSGLKLTPGQLYSQEILPLEGEWLITKPTQLYILADSAEAKVNVKPSSKTKNKNSVLKIAPLKTVIPPAKVAPATTPLPYLPSPQIKIAHWWQQSSKRYPFFKQHSNSDCGVACLVMVSKYWGKNFSINQLRAVANVDRSGASIKGLITAAESVGFMVRPRKADLLALQSQELPAIAHWEGNHYVVVYQVTKRQVIISDPAIGRRVISRQEFVAGWTGYTLLLTPTAKFEQVPETEANLWKYGKILEPYKAVLLEIFAASLIIQIIGLFSPIFTQILLDRVVVQRSVPTLIAVGTGLLIFRIFQVVISTLRRYLLYHTANRLDLSLIVGFIGHTFNLPLNYFETRYVGDITSRINENRKIRGFLTGDAITTVLDVLSLFVYVALMVWYSWKLSLLALVVVPIFAIVTIFATPFLVRISRESFNASTKEKSYLIEGLTGISTIKSMGVEQTVRWRWEDLINESIRITFSGQMIQERVKLCTDLIDTTVSSLLLIFGVWQVIQNQLTIGQLIAFNMLVANVISPIKRMITLWNNFQEIRIAIERTDDVINTPAEAGLAGENLVTIPPIKGKIRFENVTFRYDLESETNTIENLSFEIQPGQTIALVGRSGSGKTTISKLLLGLYPPVKGKITIDGYDINKISLKSLRQQTGVVNQNTFLFGGTILENLTIGHPHASQGAIEEAARLAGAADFIEELPLKYGSQVGEGGGLLSGGQRQRLAIARALLGKPRLLVLDEATSNLDAESERIIQNNLNTILKNQTTLVIAHRLSTVRQADLILVMDRGLLVESGTHEELMAQRGQYFHLNQQQLAIAH
ncbi:ABC transporter ATP-binding protein [Pleurocapsa sp. CCALA 161]|uniref:ABC transporter transmembrane domain-containing protein n=1 Tax=Pleurocapsa sp. CCALA 161 TaxID=2107688 RepID=UPI000D082093|nr:ABC transporter transmembrane domain-containing protein [Pleurocapsa sp. CCALA 161]PSB09134.1 ABC transporter ATP-binding protein [Pleurocapsa sp. CCALA 161]